ncbi:hypothetical protein [Nevskia sp.]|uniref:hypothetical protein n=1 Tax=Nevskia sp. TaxID=1929292 RepID=UPI0025D872C4|nr:hypothetical protein [Nevskia sp.]
MISSAHYLSHFINVVNETRREGAELLVTEAAVLDEAGRPRLSGVLKLPLRQDIAAVNGGLVTKSLHIETDRMLSFEPLQFSWDHDLKVSLSAFQWNELELRLHGLPKRPSWSPLQDWFHGAFGDPQQVGDGNGFLGVAHFIDDPVIETGLLSNSATIYVDLGSAPVEALEALLDAAAKVGARKLDVGQSK